MEISKEKQKNFGCFSVFLFVFFHPWRWNFFDEKDLKKRRRGVNNRASSEKSPRFREKKTTNDVKICRFLSTFFDENAYIKKKKQ